MDNKLNVQKLGYKAGDPMWVHWDDRYVLRGGHILGKCPDENLITTVGYLAYMDDKSIILGRGIENHCNEDACHAIDKMIEWYYQVEEPEFLKFYNCHLEMIK